jgi:hypothetical protein
MSQEKRVAMVTGAAGNLDRAPPEPFDRVDADRASHSRLVADSREAAKDCVKPDRHKPTHDGKSK